MTVYLDHNATSPMRPEVRECFVELLEQASANPSSLHAPGRAARQILDDARERVGAALGVHEDEVIFTASGTSSINLALRGVILAAARPAALVTSPVEHSAVLESARVLESEGHEVRMVEVDAAGRPRVEGLVDTAQGATLVSLQHANNEVGSVTDMAAVAAELSSIPPERRPLLHTDAVQALGRIPLDLEEVQLASFSVHKVGGPLGVGILVRRKGVRVRALTQGGGQETELWPGTENVPAIGAAALAVELAVQGQAEYAERLGKLSHMLWSHLIEALPDVSLVGPTIDDPARLPNTLNVLFPGVDGRVLVTRLDLAGLAASAGSACASGSLEPSHVLRALGLDEEQARAGLRLSLGPTTSDADIHRAVDILRRTLV